MTSIKKVAGEICGSWILKIFFKKIRKKIYQGQRAFKKSKFDLKYSPCHRSNMHFCPQETLPKCRAKRTSFSAKWCPKEHPKYFLGIFRHFPFIGWNKSILKTLPPLHFLHVFTSARSCLLLCFTIFFFAKCTYPQGTHKHGWHEASYFFRDDHIRNMKPFSGTIMT